MQKTHYKIGVKRRIRIWEHSTV